MNALLSQEKAFVTQDSALAALGFWRVQLSNNQVELSSEAERLYGFHQANQFYFLDEIRAKVYEEDRSILEASWQAALGGAVHDIEYRIQYADGKIAWLWEKAILELNEQQQPIYAHGIVQDITRHRELCNSLANMANHDRLTGLPNRKLLAEHLSVAISLARRNKWTLAVLFIDLDKFKQVNDQLGHDAGDELLRQVAQRMKLCLRESDLVARQGGDEFIVVLQNAGEESDVGLLALTMIEQLSRPFDLHGQVAQIGGSIGVTLLGSPQDDADTLFRQADIAMYQAKLAGRQTLVFYDSDMQSEVLARRSLEADLYRAVANQEFVMYYQPIFHLSKYSSNQVEALLRWQHPEHGLIGPEVFLSVAESSHVIKHIGQWVLTEVCQQILRWQQQGQDITVSVNISARQINEGLPVEWLADLLKQYPIPENHLFFEVNEQTLLQADSSARAWFYGIEKLGIHLALEHFGTGHASLALLNNFNIYRIKIDRSLLTQIHTDSRTRSLVKSILDIARNMVLQVVAEGVESADTLLTLQSMGCQNAQGYHLANPMPAEQITSS